MEYETVSSYICRYCKGSFDHVDNLRKHVEQIHTARPTKEKVKFCPLCGLRCAKYETYRDHLKHIHRLSEDGKVFVLKCFNDFFVWKNELEKRNYCKYVQQGQPKVIQASKDKIYVYCCDSSASSTKEKKKSSWAAKDTCPSTISAIENVTNHTVKVEHWNTHVGHAIPIGGEELDAAIGSLQTTEIVIDEQSYQSSDHDSQSGLYFLTECNDGSFSESYVKETHKKQPPALFKNNGNSSPMSMPRKFSFKKDPNKKSVSFSGSLASVACMKASVKKDSATSGTLSAKATASAKSSVVESSDSQSTTSAASCEMEISDLQSVSDAQDLKGTKSTKTSSSSAASNKKSVKGAKPLVPLKPSVSTSQVKDGNPPISESLLSNLKLMVNNEKLNGQFILLNSLQGQNGQQSLILCPVDGNLPSGVQDINVDKATLSKKEQVLKSPKSGKSSVTAVIETSVSGDTQSLKVTKSTKNYSSSTPSKSTEKSDNEVVKDLEIPADLSVEVKQGEKQSSSAGTPVDSTVDVPCSDGVKKITFPSSISVSKTPGKTGCIDGPKVSSTETPKQVKKRAPRKKKLPVEEKLPLNGATSSSITSPNNVGTTILRDQLTGQQIIVPMNVSPGMKNANSPMLNTGSIPMPVAGNILSNSLTPGVSYIQINNTLFPINSPAGPNSNFIFTTPISSAPNPRTSQPVLSFSALTQPATTTTLLVNSQKSSVSGSIPGNAINKVPSNNLSVFMIPQTGGKNATSMPMIPISGVQVPNNIGKPVASGQMAKPTQIITNSPMLPYTGNIRSSLVQTNAQFVPPRLLAVAQLCQRLNSPGSPGLTPFRGLSPITPTISNASHVKTLQLPLPVTATNQLVLETRNVNATSKPISASSVVANTGPISSTPAINIPSTPIPHPQKPGSFIFESSGDFYVLEPIEDTKELKSALPVKENTDLKLGAPKPRKVQSKVKTDVIASDAVKSPPKSNPKYTMPESSKSDTKIELKHIKPRTCSRFYDGKRVATLAQKRTYKEEDSDILQKVKYYNLEMKYLSSQAECKRLKLELAKSNFKKKESIETELITLNQDSTKEKSVPDNMILEFSDHTLEDSDELIIDQLTENLLKQIEEIEANKKISSNDDFQSDLKDNSKAEPTEIENNEEAMDCEDIYHKIHVEHPKEATNTDAKENTDVINQESEGDITDPKEEIHENFEIEDMSIDNRESLNPPIDNDKILDQTMDNSQENQSILNETPASSINNSGSVDDIAHNRELVNECLDSFVKQPEITSISQNGEHESDKTLIDQNLTIEDKSEGLQTFTKEQVAETNDTENDQHAIEDVQYFEGEKSCEKLATYVDPSEDQSAEETLKDLEIKYGEKDLDIYTMIRTSVLRSLYADMQDLCEENKKLFEELQSLKSHEETYEVIVQETPTEQL